MKDYYRMQVKLDYVRDKGLIELLKNAKNKQEVLRRLYIYATFYGVFIMTDGKIYWKEEKDNA